MGNNALGDLLPLIVLVLLGYLLLVRPMRRRSRQAAELQSSLAVGRRVMMGSGIFGTVRALDADDRVQVEIADGVVVEVLRAAVTRILTDEPSELGAAPGRDTAPETEAEAAHRLEGATTDRAEGAG